MPTAASLSLDQPTKTTPVIPDRWRHRYLSTRVVVMACVVSSAILIAVAAYIFTLSPPAFMDLDVYREGVQAWWHGGNMYGTLPETIAGNYLPFIYPPFAAIVFGPLAALPWMSSAIVMMALSLISLAVVIYVTVRRIWPGGGVRGALLAVAVLTPAVIKIQPVWDTLWFGQINLVLMLLVALDCLVVSPKWPRGALIGIAAAVKLTPAVFVLYFLLRKDFRSALTAAVTGAAATAIGFLANWSGSAMYWFGSSGGARSVSGSLYYTNQTIDGGLARLGLAKHELTVLWLALVAVVLVFAVVAVRRAHLTDNAPLAMVVTAGFGLIASPTSWGHHYVYVVPALIVMGAHAVRTRSTGWIVALAVTTAMFFVAPFMYLPGGGNVELTWAWWQQLPGNSYTLLTAALLICFAAPVVRAALRDQFGKDADELSRASGPTR
jgi:alpha-1,2-mannosyltransferase